MLCVIYPLRGIRRLDLRRQRLGVSNDHTPFDGKGESSSSRAAPTLFRRPWPVFVLGLGLVVTVAWIALLGYGLAKLL